jgi:hypothetical protein
VFLCRVCEDCGWVCENHPDTPLEGQHACTCGGAGMPCPRCNLSDQDTRRLGCRTVSMSTSRAMAEVLFESKIEFNGIGGLRTYVRIVPVSLVRHVYV